jgi:hypothetical protein
MAGLSRRLTLAASISPLLLLAMAGWARANTIIVNTLDSGSQLAPLCTLEDAVMAAETQAPVNGCAGGTGLSDTIEFIVTGTIVLDNTLEADNDGESLSIEGPSFAGITIDGNEGEIVDAEVTTLTLENLTFQDGGSDEGGAVYSDDAEVIILNSTFTGNDAFLGGGVFAFDSLMAIVNSTFFDNSAVEDGGGVANEGSELVITNDTFDANSTKSGSGADVATDDEEIGSVGIAPPQPGIFSLANSSIFANSLSSANCDGIDDGGYNISDDDSCDFSGTSINNSTTLNLDPTGLENNGGPTQTVALEPDSQAIDFVPIADCTVPIFDEPVTTDQRGYGRPDPDNLDFCDAGAYEFDALPPFLLIDEKIQIARSSSPNSDLVNMNITFTENPSSGDDCASDQDALDSGIDVSLFEGTCAMLPATGLELSLTPFVVHTVGRNSYGTILQTMAPEEVLARIVPQFTPPDSCGQWNLNVEVSGLNTPSIDLGGGNPFALVLTDIDGDATGCFDVDNVIQGNQVDPPRKVRRALRR